MPYVVFIICNKNESQRMQNSIKTAVSNHL